jgi:transposase-like protein
MQTLLSRQERGKKIAGSPSQIQRVDGVSYKVNSQSGNGAYDVHFSTIDGWKCSCPDHTYRDVKCKHICAVEFSLKIREVVQPTVIEPVEIDTCLYCKSPLIVKDGVRRNKYGDLQIWNCKSCGRYFTINVGFEHMKHNPQGVTTAMQLYFSGESLRNVAKSLRLIGVQVSHKTVFMWIKKYTALMEKYLERITPQVSDTWRADELYLKVKGKMNYLYALMDDETRFWIAQEVASSKFTADARPLFANGKRIAGKKPKVLITDGAPNFHEAFQKEFADMRRYYNPQHIQEIHMDGKVHNNKMERMNGEIRDREKVMRSLKTPDTPILTGYQIYHNYIRPHLALDGQTPADKAGIEVRGKNKWLTLIQNAEVTEQTAR